MEQNSQMQNNEVMQREELMNQMLQNVMKPNKPEIVHNDFEMDEPSVQQSTNVMQNNNAQGFNANMNNVAENKQSNNMRNNNMNNMSSNQMGNMQMQNSNIHSNMQSNNMQMQNSNMRNNNNNMQMNMQMQNSQINNMQMQNSQMNSMQSNMPTNQVQQTGNVKDIFLTEDEFAITTVGTGWITNFIIEGNTASKSGGASALLTNKRLYVQGAIQTTKGYFNKLKSEAVINIVDINSVTFIQEGNPLFKLFGLILTVLGLYDLSMRMPGNFLSVAICLVSLLAGVILLAVYKFKPESKIRIDYNNGFVIFDTKPVGFAEVQDLRDKLFKAIDTYTDVISED